MPPDKLVASVDQFFSLDRIHRINRVNPLIKNSRAMISKTTYIYGFFLVLAASFLQQVLTFANKIFGENNIKIIFYLMCLIGVCFLLFRIINNHLDFKHILVIVTTLTFSWFLISVQQFFGEKTHVILYGILGYITIQDIYKKNIGTFRALLYTGCFTFLISFLDEIFQAILPYRVGEVRDILTNILSIGVGISVYFGLKRNP